MEKTAYFCFPCAPPGLSSPFSFQVASHFQHGKDKELAAEERNAQHDF